MRAVLYLHQCEPDHAQSALFSIPKVGILCVLKYRLQLLFREEATSAVAGFHAGTPSRLS